MLKLEELAFIEVISTLQLSPALLMELGKALSSRKQKKKKKKKTVVSAGSCSTAPGGVPRTSQPPSKQHAGKRKAKVLVSAGDSIETANRCPAPGAGSAPLPAISSVRGELAAVGSQQLGPHEVGVTYEAVLTEPVPPFQPSW